MLRIRRIQTLKQLRGLSNKLTSTKSTTEPENMSQYSEKAEIDHKTWTKIKQKRPSNVKDLNDKQFEMNHRNRKGKIIRNLPQKRQ